MIGGILSLVRDHLRDTVDGNILQEEEIQIAVRGQPFPSWGQFFCGIFGNTRVYTMLPVPTIESVIYFTIKVSKRTRDYGQDRTEEAVYMDDLSSLAYVTNHVKEKILLNNDLLVKLKTAYPTISFSDHFRVTSEQLDPTELVPLWYLSSDESSERPAGYSLDIQFRTPVITELRSC
jgi:hypothetical protein